MHARKILLGEMWKSEASGEVYVVTSFYRELFSSYACLRNVNPQNSESFRKVKMLTTDSGETLVGFRIAELI
jgi:hypothetical protein